MSEVSQIGVVGAGFMGSGIAESAARAGITMHIYEPDQGPLDRSRERIQSSVDRAVSGGKFDADAAAGLLERITFTTDLDALSDAELVVEAVVEDEDIKQELF